MYDHLLAKNYPTVPRDADPERVEPWVRPLRRFVRESAEFLVAGLIPEAMIRRSLVGMAVDAVSGRIRSRSRRMARFLHFAVASRIQPGDPVRSETFVAEVQLELDRFFRREGAR